VHRPGTQHLHPLRLPPFACHPWLSSTLRQDRYRFVLFTFPPLKHSSNVLRFLQLFTFQWPFFFRSQDVPLPPSLPLLPASLQVPLAWLALLRAAPVFIGFLVIFSLFLLLQLIVVQPFPILDVLSRTSLNQQFVSTMILTKPILH